MPVRIVKLKSGKSGKSGRNAARRRAVAGEGLRAQLELSTTRLDFGECVLRRPAPVSYERQCILALPTRMDAPLVGWMLGDGSTAAAECAVECGSFSINPERGVLRRGEVATVSVRFTPNTAGRAAVALPLKQMCVSLETVSFALGSKMRDLSAILQIF